MVTPSTSAQTVAPTNDMYYLNEVTVNPIPSEYIIPSGTYTVSGSGTADITNYATLSVPSGSAGSPALSVGEVTNHSVTVRASTIRTEGWIPSGTVQGASRNISASDLVSGTKSITSNGTGIDVTNYASVDVAVPSGQPSLQAKTNIDPTTSSQTITADTGYDGLSSVQINAMPSGTEGTPTATKGTVTNHSVSITPSVTNSAGYISGGTHSGTAVSVSASELVSGTYTVSSSGTADVTNYASISVASGGATASATKGTVSNHSVTVTPSVTRTAGYITAGSANGTAVTVSASELVSGSETKTANGTYDVTNLAELVVNVSGGGGSSDVVMGTLTVASNVNTSTSTQITTTSAIGFTPTKFFFWKDSRTATSNHVHQATFTTIGSYYIRTMTRYSSNALSTSGNTNNWTTQTAGYLYYNSNTVYFRSSSSYILSSGTWHWVAVK